MKRFFSVLVVVFSFFMFSFNVDATTLQDLYDDLSSLESSYNAAKKQQALTKAELNKLKASIANTEAEIVRAQNDINRAEADIKSSEEEIALKKEETNQLLLYLQLMNSKGDSVLDYIMDVDNYTDFIYRYSVITQMSDYNQQIVEELDALVLTLNNKKVELANKQKDLEQKRKDLQEQQVIIQMRYNDEQDETLDVADQITAKRKLIKHYEGLGCKRNQNVNSCNGIAAVDGWVYPMDRFYQTSNYGFDENRYHYAVDLHAAEGNNVRAVGNGEVIYSGVYWRKNKVGVESCGGLVVQVKHTYKGVDYISVYMHLLSSGVSVGKKVSAGDIIGTSGGGSLSIAKWKDDCTGGAHLHFTMAYGSSVYNTSSSSVGTTFNPIKFFPVMKGIGSTYNW